MRAKIAELEARRLFNGESYPHPIVKFPHVLTGRGFFPGGDGLWRDSVKVSHPATVRFPIDGVLILGQDFGTKADYPPLSRPYELPSLLTWKYLVPRLERAEIPPDRVFFSNGLLGLRRNGPGRGRNPALEFNEYVAMCREFLEYQIELQNPRLIIVFDSLEKSVYSPVFSRVPLDLKKKRICMEEVVGRKRVLVGTQHPSSDYGVVNSNKVNYDDRCNTLKRAWLAALAVA